MTLLWRALGASVAEPASAYVDVPPPVEQESIELGARSVLADGVLIFPHVVDHGAMRHSRVRIGEGAVCVGPRSLAQAGAVVSAGCAITPLTLVLKHEVLPGHMLWSGSLAERLCDLDAPPRPGADAAGGGTAGDDSGDARVKWRARAGDDGSSTATVAVHRRHADADATGGTDYAADRTSDGGAQAAASHAKSD